MTTKHIKTGVIKLMFSYLQCEKQLLTTLIYELGNLFYVLSTNEMLMQYTFFMLYQSTS